MIIVKAKDYDLKNKELSKILSKNDIAYFRYKLRGVDDNDFHIAMDSEKEFVKFIISHKYLKVSKKLISKCDKAFEEYQQLLLPRNPEHPCDIDYHEFATEYLVNKLGVKPVKEFDLDSDFDYLEK